MTSILAINVSNIISPLCYSVLKLEPYSMCSMGCIYCYARWYWSANYIKPQFTVIKYFKKTLKKIHVRGLRPIPFRLSTLVDPFQPEEEKFKISLELLKISHEYEYPLIINTKSILFTKNPWINLMEKLLDMGKAIIQVSITTLDDRISKVLETRTPKPKARLKVLKDLGTRGYPVVIRLSPFIPMVSTLPSINELVGILKDIGVKHVIVEGLRLEKDLVSKFYDLVKNYVNLNEVKLESYSIVEEGRILKLSLDSKLKWYVALRNALMREGISFSTCKEGLFELHTAPDCCGMYLFKDDYVVRLTLNEVYRKLLDIGGLSVDEVGKFINDICRISKVLCSNDAKSYPREIAKALIKHERRLPKVLTNASLLSKVSPNMSLEDNTITLKKLLTK